MGVSRRRLVAISATVLAVALGGLAPGALTGTTAGAAGNPYEVSKWTDENGEQHLTRWNPCQTITYAVNPRLAGRTAKARAKAVDDVQRSFRRAGKRSGLNFRFAGRTTELPRNTSKGGWYERQKAAEIVVAWVDQSKKKYRTDVLSRSGSGYASGVGGWRLRGWKLDSGRWRGAIGRGYVVINAAHNPRYKPGFGSGVTRGALLLHEIGHALGLGHAGRTRELMYPTMLRRERSNYKRGDEMGLHKVGRRQGCIVGASKYWEQI